MPIAFNVPSNGKNLKYVCEKLKIAAKTAAVLMENDRDENLLISQLISTFKPKDSVKISPNFLLKILIFKQAKVIKYDFDEISYMLGTIFNLGVTAESEFIHDPTEAAAKQNILLSAVFGKPMSKRTALFTREGFNRCGQKVLAGHINQWIDIIQDVEDTI